MSLHSRLSAAARQVDRLDHERFVTALFAPPARREALMALYAFNIELSLVRERTAEPMVGLIRLQWWRDALLGEDERRGAGHPLVPSLRRLIAAHAPAAEAIERLITGRERDFDPAPPVDLAEIERVAGTGPALLTGLALTVLGGDSPDEHIAGHHVGYAWGVIGVIRARAYHRAIGRVIVPDDLGAIKTLAARARWHLAEARGHPVRRDALAAVLPAVLADGHLATLRRANWSPDDPRVTRPRPRPLALVRAAWRGQF